MTTEFYIGIIVGLITGLIIAPYLYLFFYAPIEKKVNINIPGKITDENIDGIINDALKDLPSACFMCEYYTNDPYNHCCDHPDLSPEFTNINTYPKRCRMDGCPLG